LLAVPNASAQKAVDRLVASGVRGILNFVPVPLKVPAHVKVENIDMTMSLEKLAYLVRKEMEEKGK
jgi:redox-sensing transcriptional repressor